MAAVTASAVKPARGTNIKSDTEQYDSSVPRFKIGYLTAPDTTDAADTVSVDLYKEFKIKKLLGVLAFAHTTTDSVIIEETLVTTVVDRDTLTITVPAGSDNDKRFYKVYGI